jgi:hypothetical protein
MALERCCATCGTCAGPLLLPAGGLRSINVVVCRGSSKETLAALKQLVSVAVPTDPEAVFENPGWPPPPHDDFIFNGYRWHSDAEEFVAEASAYPTDGGWIGQFDLTRCLPTKTLEEWELADGSVVRILRSEVVEDPPGERRILRFSYLSHCILRDSQCRDAEAAALWPRVQALAERDEASVVYLTAEDCKLGSSTVFPRQDEHGVWDLPWLGCCG